MIPKDTPADIASKFLKVPYLALDERAQKIAVHVAERRHISRNLANESEPEVTRCAFSSEEALKSVESYKPFCVMLDIYMPGMNGLELAKCLRRQFDDDVVLIAVTGMDTGNACVAETFDLVDHYFTKPIPAADLAKIFPPKAVAP